MKTTKARRATLTLLLSGSFIFQFGIGACREVSYIFNPCGTVFTFCTPEQIDFYNNPVPDYENFPNCTIPLEEACGEASPFPPGPGPRPVGPGSNP